MIGTSLRGTARGPGGAAGAYLGEALGAAILACLAEAQVLPAPLLGQERAPEHRAAAIAQEIVGVRWGTTCREWAETERGGRCEDFRSSGSYASVADRWCRRGVAEGQVGTVRFHVLDATEEPPGCRLTAYRATVRGRAAATHAALEEALTSRHGPPGTPASADGRGSYYWRDLRLWRTDAFEALLYRKIRPPRGEQEVTIRVRSLALVRMLAENGAYRRPPPPPSPDGDSLIAATLPPETPGYSLQGTEVDPGAREPPALEALRRLVPGLPDHAPGDRAARLLLADRLMDRVAGWASARIQDTALVRVVTEATRRLGSEPTYDPLGYAWNNPHRFLLRAWRDAPETDAGRIAFVELQQRGWDLTGRCGAGSDEFRNVIRRGREFLATGPPAPYRLPVVYSLARANETWWSLSRARNDTYVNPADYAAGAEAARRAAIEQYRRLLDAGPHTVLREDVLRRDARLRLGVDTGQRAYFCVYD